MKFANIINKIKKYKLKTDKKAKYDKIRRELEIN